MAELNHSEALRMLDAVMYRIKPNERHALMADCPVEYVKYCKGKYPSSDPTDAVMAAVKFAIDNLKV